MTTKRRRILVIDDSEVMLTRVKRALVAAGYDVTATDQAVGNARHIPNCDLAIIDFHMPGIDGGTVISSLRSAAASMGHPCSFYLYTADPNISRAFAGLGFDGCFTEKGDEQALVRQVQAAFRLIHIRELGQKGKSSMRPGTTSSANLPATTSSANIPATRGSSPTGGSDPGSGNDSGDSGH